jgi:hypothetical protein
VCGAAWRGSQRLAGAMRLFTSTIRVWDLLDDSIDLFFWCDWIS